MIMSRVTFFKTVLSDINYIRIFLCILILWIAALTICLPLTISLILCKTLRRKFFVWLFVDVRGEIHKRVTAPARQKSFEFLNNNLPKKSSNSSPFEVLEIGPGEALNLPYYPDNCNVTFVDPNENFDSYLKRSAQKCPGKVTSWKRIGQWAEDMSQVGDNTVDIVISTYVHCSCKDSQAALREVRRVLKPGGKYLFLEHVSFPKGDVGYVAQRIMHPLWYLYYDGCHLQRDFATEIKKSAFSEVTCEGFSLDNMYLIQPQIVGVATK